MKTDITVWMVLLSLCFTAIPPTFAQTLPNSFNYQGRLTDTAGTPLPNGNYQMIFSIWDAATGGNQLWGSGNKTVALNKGMFTTSLGPIPATALPAANTFLQVQMGTDTPMPRIALGAVPYALKAVELLWPAVASISNTNPVLTLTNTGAGPAISAVNTGTGWAGTFVINNPGNSTAALLANTNGSGNALHASTSGSRNAVYGNTSGAGSGVYGTTSSTGNGVYGVATGNGTAARFETTGTTDHTTMLVKNQAVGGAAFFESVGGMGTTLTSHTTGNGSAGVFDLDKVSSTQPSLLAKTTGSGPAIKAVPGTGLAGQFDGILQANTLKLPSGAADGFVLGSDAAGLASWRRDGLTLPYSITATTAEDTFSLQNRGTGKAMWLGIDNPNSTAPTLHLTGNHKGPGLLVDGQAAVGGFRMAIGASNGYVMKSDANGVGSWKAVDTTFADIVATNNIKTLGLEVDSRGVNSGTLNSGGIHFGYASGEGIFSKRSAGGNQYGLDIATNHIPRISITQSGNVGIGINPPLHNFHVQGSKAGNYTSPLSYIENTNSTGNSSPALRLGGSGNSIDGVLNISNFGTGKIAVFGGTGGEVASVDVNGNLAMSGALSARNLPAVRFTSHTDYISWGASMVRYLETAAVTAPANGHFVIDATLDYGTDASAKPGAQFFLKLYDATDMEHKTPLRVSSCYLSSSIALRQQLCINWCQPTTVGQSITFLLEGDYDDESDARFWSTGSTLRVLFVPNSL